MPANRRRETATGTVMSDDPAKANAILHALIGNREAEIERLRAALKFVTDGHCPTCTEDMRFCNTDKCVLRNAEAALEQKSP